MEIAEDIGTENDAELVMPRKANEVMAEALAATQQSPLFDGFWQSGEVALLFGASGVGKSLLAVQLADALARGRPIGGFQMPRRRHKVLYVDLTLSEAQFRRRYTPAGDDGAADRAYRFPERLYRGRPRYDEDLCAWVRKMVRVGGFEVVVIDDLSAVARTDDGTFDTLRIMREMKRLSHDMNTSVLVLADSLPSRRRNNVSDISESDLRRSRVLCGVADSVFALGVAEKTGLKLVQFRSQGAEVLWGVQNPVGCTIGRDESGLPGLVFDERFKAELDIDRCNLICDVKWHREDGLTFRQIAAEMGISKTQAYRLYREFTPAASMLVHCGVDPFADEPEEYEGRYPKYDDDRETDEYDDRDPDEYEDADLNEAIKVSARVLDEPDQRPWHARIDPSAIPFAAALGRRSILDLEPAITDYGKPIYVESRDEYFHRPNVWYYLHSDNQYYRSTRNSLGISTTRLGPSHYIPEMRL